MPATTKNTDQRAWARIDTAALRSNLERVRQFAPQSRVMAVIKANGYGHGAIRLAQALQDADALAVATLPEAAALREAEFRLPITVLGGPLSIEQVNLAESLQLDLVIHDTRQLPWIEAYEGGFWFKLDTGMHRLGFDPGTVPSLRDWLNSRNRSNFRGWVTHLACADEPRNPMTDRQLDCFTGLLEGEPGPRCIANSAAVCAWPAAHADWVRPGIMLYGASPLLGSSAAELGLKPVMHLYSQLLCVRELAAGEPVGYGADWTTPEPLRVGIAAIGYGDGYPRHAPSGTPVAVKGVRTALVGRVSMDMIAIDLRGCPDAQPGDSVELWGDTVAADEVADAAGTIAYELFCGVGSRVNFSYG